MSSPGDAGGGPTLRIREFVEQGGEFQLSQVAIRITDDTGQPVAVHFAVGTLSYSRRFHF